MELQHKMEQQQFNLLEIIQVLVKRKMLIIKMSALALVASIVYSLLLTNMYSATARILPPQKDSGGGLSALLGQSGGMAGLVAGGFGGGSDLYVGILKSRSLADAVIQRPGIADGFKGQSIEVARNNLAGAVKIQAGKDGIISITAEDKDPKRSALLANAFADELSRMTIRLNLSKAGTERLFLEKRLELVKTDLKLAEDDLKKFSQSNQIAAVDSQAKAAIEGVARLKAELASKEVQLAVLTSRETEQSPEVKATRMGIRKLKAELGALVGTSSGDQGIPSIGNMPNLGLEYSRKLRELKTQEAIFEQLTKQYEMAKLNEAKDSSSLQVLDEAVVPLNRCSPKRAQIVVLSVVTIFFLSIITVLVQEHVAKASSEDKRIIDDIKRNLFTLKPTD